MSLGPGDVLAGYTILRPLGSGGMGAVYLARHPRLPRSDAMKVLRAELSSDPAFAARFMREADVLAGLSHPNIVSVLDRGEDTRRLWLTMQYVDGIDAETALERAGGRLPAGRVGHILAGVAAALDRAHRQHVVHRDVKPANILLAAAAEPDEPEQVFLTDFGIAKALDGPADRLTRTGMVVATFDYASPEQIESRPLDGRADVYALGCVLFKLVTGRVPYPGETMLAAVHGHLNAPPPRPTAVDPDLPAGLDDVVARAMAKDPAERYPTCRALSAAVAAALAARPPAPRTVVPRTAVRPPRTEESRAVTTSTPPPLPAPLPAPRPAPPSVQRSAARTPLPAHPPVARHIRPATPPPWVHEPAPSTGAATPATGPPAPPPTSPPTSPPAPSAPPLTPSSAGLPAPPRELRPERRSRRRRVPLAIVAGVLIAAGGAWWALGSGGEPGKPEVSSDRSEPAAPAELALEDLPRAGPLAGSSLVAVRNLDGQVHLYVVDTATGATTTPLTSGPAQDVGPVISPDRQTVVYVRVAADGSATLRAVAADGSGDRPLFGDGFSCPAPGRPAWNRADPTQLALTCTDAGRTELRLVGLDGGTIRVLDAGQPRIGDLSFSPDGTRLAYWGTSAPDADGGPLYTLPADGSAAPVPLTDVGPGVDADPVWSPDGQLVAFRREIGPGERRIFTVAADGSGEQQLTGGTGFDQDPIWSPDGAMIAFKSNRTGPARPAGDHVWVMTAGGADLRQLDDQGGTATNAPAWGNR